MNDLLYSISKVLNLLIVKFKANYMLSKKMLAAMCFSLFGKENSCGKVLFLWKEKDFAMTLTFWSNLRHVMYERCWIRHAMIRSTPIERRNLVLINLRSGLLRFITRLFIIIRLWDSVWTQTDVDGAVRCNHKYISHVEKCINTSES